MTRKLSAAEWRGEVERRLARLERLMLSMKGAVPATTGEVRKDFAELERDLREVGE